MNEEDDPVLFPLLETMISTYHFLLLQDKILAKRLMVEKKLKYNKMSMRALGIAMVLKLECTQ